MKRRKTGRYIVSFLVCMLIAGSIYVLPAKAGLSSIVVDNTSFDKKLDTSLWNNPDGDVEIKDGALFFSKKSTDTTSLITRTSARLSEYYDNLASADITMKLVQIPKNEKFVIAFGLGSVEALMGEPGNVEIGFENDGALKVSVTAYDDNGEAVKVVKPTSLGSATSKVDVKATITGKSVLNLTVNGKKICNKKLPCTGEGRVGFLQTGSCEVIVSDVHITTYEYDRPENCNVSEDFEKETLNINALTSKMVYPSMEYAPTRTYIDEIDGNRVFRFDNAGVVYIGSLYKYSNFELTFDVLDLQREHVYDEEGNITKPKSMNFAVSYGDEAADYIENGYMTSTDILVFGDSAVTSYFTGEYGSAKAKGYDFYSPNCDKDFSIRVSMKDSVVTVGVKWIGEKEFTDFMSYQVSERTPTGYVHIWTTSTVANLAIDNLKLINTDVDPNLLEVDFKSALVTTPEDYDYQPMEYTYMKQETKGDNEGFNIYLIIPMFAGVCLITLGAVWFAKKKKTIRKDGDTDEK